MERCNNHRALQLYKMKSKYVVLLNNTSWTTPTDLQLKENIYFLEHRSNDMRSRVPPSTSLSATQL